MGCPVRPDSERIEDVKEVMPQSLGDRWEAGVDKMLEKAGKKIGKFANYIDKDLKILKYISTSSHVKKVSRIVNDVHNDNVNLAKEATRLFDFIENEVSKTDGVLLTRALGGDLPISELPSHLQSTYTRFRKVIDQAADNLVEVGALSEKNKMENYLKRYYTKYLEESDKSRGLLGRVFKRKDLTLEQRVDLGMVEDAGFVIANTLLDQKKQLARYRLLKQLSDTFAVDEERAGYVRVSDATHDGVVKKWGALSGKWIPEDVMMELKTTAEVADAVSWMDRNFLTHAVDHIKVNVTVKNPGTHAYNIASNLQLAALKGDLGALKDIVMMSKADRKKLWELGKSLGLENELAEYEKIHAKIKADTIASPKEGFFKIFAKNLYLAEDTKLGTAVREVYQMEDEVFKMASFYKRMKKLKNPTPDDLKSAMREAMADYVDYSTPLPPLVRWLDKNGLFPFSHYVWKSTPRVGLIILKNPLKFMALQTALYGMNAGLFNDNEDDYVKPHWAKEKGLFGLWEYLPTNLFFAKQWVQMGEGSDNFINLGRSLPGARLSGLSVDLGFVGATASLIQGRDPLFKRKIYSDEDSNTVAVLKTLQKASENYLPPVTLGRYAQQWISIAAGNGPKNYYGEDLSIGESVQRVAGVRKFNPKKEINTSIKDVVKKWGYENIDDDEMQSRISQIMQYAKEHGIKVEKKKINRYIKRTRKKREELDKNLWYWLNKGTI